MRFLYFSFIFVLISCINKDKSNTKYIEFPCNNVTSILSEDSTKNYEALVKSRKLYYIEHAEINNLDNSNDNWEKIDSNFVDSLLIITHFRGCDSNGYHCLNIEKHTLWNNKIIKFEGVGSGYFATIDFKHNQQGKLIAYRKSNIEFKLFYHQHFLKEVVKFEILDESLSAVEKYIFIQG